MRGERAIIQHLNAVLRNELTAINQYFLHSRMLEHWGFNRLAKQEYEESIEEMKHADDVAKRILFLEGLPNFQDLGKLLTGEDVPEILANDLKLELAARTDLVVAIAEAEAIKDFTTRELLDGMLKETESHIDDLETELGLIDKVGLANYLQSQM